MRTNFNRNDIQNAREVFSGYIAGKKLRMTPQRNLILDVFLKTERHVSSEELYLLVRKKDKTIGQATVYRMLRLLSEADIAREVDFGDGLLRYEHKINHAHHDHLICEECKMNIEVIDERIETAQEELAREHGFDLTGHSMYLYGICEECRKGGNREVE